MGIALGIVVSALADFFEITGIEPFDYRNRWGSGVVQFEGYQISPGISYWAHFVPSWEGANYRTI